MQPETRIGGYSRSDVEELRIAGLRVVVIDVRTAEEYARGTALDAEHVPPDRLDALAPSWVDATVVTVCAHGGHRSQGAAAKLRALGVASAGHLIGGVSGSPSELVGPDGPR